MYHSVVLLFGSLYVQDVFGYGYYVVAKGRIQTHSQLEKEQNDLLYITYHYFSYPSADTVGCLQHYL